MPRPEFPNYGGPFPVEYIREMRDRQEAYDRDPDAYERRERWREEQRREEEEMLRWEMERMERLREEESDLPF